MANFDRFKKLAVSATKTARCTLYGLQIGGDKPPVLIVLPATDANPNYYNAMLRSKTTQAAARRGVPTLKQLQQDREEDVLRYAKHVIRGWEDVVNDDGTPVPFSEKECIALLEMVLENASDVFLELRSFCQDMDNFREQMDVEGAAGNS